eukprot:1488660-Pleurochrysis_carterae.AAC.1
MPAMRAGPDFCVLHHSKVSQHTPLHCHCLGPILAHDLPTNQSASSSAISLARASTSHFLTCYFRRRDFRSSATLSIVAAEAHALDMTVSVAGAEEVGGW